MKVLSIKSFCQEKGFVSLASVVRENTNRYPFVTFINEDNKAENIYFSKNASVHVTAGTPVTAELLKAHQIAYVTNEAGEERIKLVSNSERVSIADLLE